MGPVQSWTEGDTETLPGLESPLTESYWQGGANGCYRGNLYLMRVLVYGGG